MIAKHIKRKTPDIFARLVRHIATVEEEGGKSERLWAVNYLASAGLDYLGHIIN